MKILILPNGDAIRSSAIMLIEALPNRPGLEKELPACVQVHYTVGGNSRCNVSEVADYMTARCERDALITDWMMIEEPPKAEKPENPASEPAGWIGKL